MRWELRPLEAGPPRPQLAADQALLEAVRPGQPPTVRWYVADAPALVLGFAQRLRASELVDRDRCRAAGVELLERRAGGGAVLLDDGMLCLAVALPLPHPLVGDDLTASYRWLGARLAAGLRAVGAARARRLDLAEARARAARLAADRGPAGDLLRATCYAGVSPHEVVVGPAKLAGLAQVRRRQAALFQVGILLRDQSALAGLLRPADEEARAAFRRRLARRSVGLVRLLGRAPDPAELVRALEPYVAPPD